MLTCGTLLIFLFGPKKEAVSIGSSSLVKEMTTVKASSLAEFPELTYELVLSEEQSGKLRRRYITKEKLLDGTYQNVTVQRWMALLTTRSNQEYSNAQIAKFSDVLHAAVDMNMKAFFFETKGVNFHSASTKAFEFVLTESSSLYDFADNQQDDSDFGALLLCGNDIGCVFTNLGGDSTLIAPSRANGTAKNVYGHLAAFLRRAPKKQVIAFWRLAIETVIDKLENNQAQSYWFSTDGRGVKWLHMRIDPRPKYYDYRPFADET